ncbi:chlorophyllide reductase [Bradyrhizobium quebecense]|uniref:Chlorophyllide reductase n=1 Tax=Bradyrhizobium quebecense TaxID=2748629 RepID=A0A974AJE2_9BRAD|nr:chlorophyllide reductase [Bradyrhizobium quebecense]UGA43994.1 chlorophyllide reductase [Bradyrhizobium quebecense]
MLVRPAHAICAVLLLTTAAHAQPSTSRGQISVAQVRAMLDQAATNPTARQTLTAYLAGTGETAGWLLDAARGLPPCARRLTLDAQQARDAIASAASTAATETPATPLIIRDMLKRAGCRLTE